MRRKRREHPRPRHFQRQLSVHRAAVAAVVGAGPDSRPLCLAMGRDKIWRTLETEIARIRTQMSAGHDTEHLDQAIEAFAKVGRELKLINGVAA